MTHRRPRRGVAAATLALIGFASMVSALRATAQVVLRGGREIVAPVASVSEAGVALAPPGAPPMTLSWGVVRSVGGEHAAEADALRGLSDDVWRARSRLARGDVALAEPLFESLAARSIPGVTGADVALGLLRCRLARAPDQRAVPAWLDALARRRALEREQPPPDPKTPSLVPALSWAPMDGATGLLHDLPPIPLRVGGAPLAPAARAAGDAVLDALASLYSCAFAPPDADAPLPKIDPETLADPGVALVHAVVLAQRGDAEQRARARSALLANIDADAGSWPEAWKRAALGLSFLRENSDALRRPGLLQLLHLPARFQDSQPALCALALREAAAELERQGEPDAAAALRAESGSLAARAPSEVGQ